MSDSESSSSSSTTGKRFDNLHDDMTEIMLSAARAITTDFMEESLEEVFKLSANAFRKRSRREHIVLFGETKTNVDSGISIRFCKICRDFDAQIGDDYGLCLECGRHECGKCAHSWHPGTFWRRSCKDCYDAEKDTREYSEKCKVDISSGKKQRKT